MWGKEKTKGKKFLRATRQGEFPETELSSTRSSVREGPGDGPALGPPHDHRVGPRTVVSRRFQGVAMRSPMTPTRPLCPLFSNSLVSQQPLRSRVIAPTQRSHSMSLEGKDVVGWTIDDFDAQRRRSDDRGGCGGNKRGCAYGWGGFHDDHRNSPQASDKMVERQSNNSCSLPQLKPQEVEVEKNEEIHEERQHGVHQSKKMGTGFLVNAESKGGEVTKVLSTLDSMSSVGQSNFLIRPQGELEELQGPERHLLNTYEHSTGQERHERTKRLISLPHELFMPDSLDFDMQWPATPDVWELRSALTFDDDAEACTTSRRQFAALSLNEGKLFETADSVGSTCRSPRFLETLGAESGANERSLALPDLSPAAKAPNTLSRRGSFMSFNSRDRLEDSMSSFYNVSGTTPARVMMPPDPLADFSKGVCFPVFGVPLGVPECPPQRIDTAVPCDPLGQSLPLAHSPHNFTLPSLLSLASEPHTSPAGGLGGASGADSGGGAGRLASLCRFAPTPPADATASQPSRLDAATRLDGSRTGTRGAPP